MSGERRVRVRIRGQVQGVWFRAWTIEEATARGLDGWVRNRRDGSVEAVFAGAEGDVDRMIALCRSGPPMSRVARVEVDPESEDVPPGFQGRPTP